MDLEKLEWSDYMLKQFHIQRSEVPKIKISSSDDFGRVSTVDVVNNVPITG